MCEEKRAIRNLPQMLDEVKGIGVVLIGEGDLSQDLGYPRQYEHPEVAAAIDDILAICKEAGVPCGHPHVDGNNVEALIEKGFRWLMPAPSQSFTALQKGLAKSGRGSLYCRPQRLACGRDARGPRLRITRTRDRGRLACRRATGPHNRPLRCH